jgi:hypothetical protein
MSSSCVYVYVQKQTRLISYQPTQQAQYSWLSYNVLRCSLWSLQLVRSQPLGGTTAAASQGFNLGTNRPQVSGNLSSAEAGARGQGWSLMPPYTRGSASLHIPLSLSRGSQRGGTQGAYWHSHRPISVYRLGEMPIQRCRRSVSAPRGKAGARDLR